jgi:hypothetical protein
MAFTIPALVSLMLVSGFAIPKTALAQDVARIKFEVISVKPASHDDNAPSFRRGGPGTSDPELATREQFKLMWQDVRPGLRPR